MGRAYGIIFCKLFGWHDPTTGAFPNGVRRCKDCGVLLDEKNNVIERNGKKQIYIETLFPNE